MQNRPHITYNTLQEVSDRIFSSQRLTHADQTLLIDAILSGDCRSLEEETLINNVFEALEQGSIWIAC